MIKSITNDNVEQFERDFGSYIQEGNVFFGAYSLLSILYIFNAKKILKEYQSVLIKNYKKDEIAFNEELLIDEKFSKIAKLNYREYKKAKEVSPVEVLVLQGKYKKAIKLSNTLNLNVEQQKRIKKILKTLSFSKINVSDILDWSQQVKIEKNFSFFNWQFLCSILAICIAVISIILVSTNDILKHGDGSKEHPYRIYTSADFEQVRNNPDANYKLMGDIDLTQIATIDIFSGVIDLSNYTINVNKPIFNTLHSTSIVKYGTIKNTDNISISQEYMGFLCNYNLGEIEDINIWAGDYDVTFTKSDNTYFGVLVGCNKNSIKDCRTSSLFNEKLKCYSSLYGNNHNIGGIAGYNEGIIENCKNDTKIVSTFQDVGGICGCNNNEGKITNCYNGSNLATTNSNSSWIVMIGGITPINKGNIYKSKNSGEISGTSINNDTYSGGIVGYLSSNGIVDGCKNIGKVNSSAKQSAFSGGIVGYATSNTLIKYCINNANLNSHSTYASAYSGGIVGGTVGNIENCFVGYDSIITATDDEDVNNYISLTGGIVAKSNGNILNCISTGKCKNAYYNGGIVGDYVDGTSMYEKNYWLYQGSLSPTEHAEAYNQVDSIATRHYWLSNIYKLSIYKDIISYVGV